MEQPPRFNPFEERMAELLAEVARQDSEWRAMQQRLEAADPSVVVAYDELPSWSVEPQPQRPSGVRV